MGVGTGVSVKSTEQATTGRAPKRRTAEPTRMSPSSPSWRQRQKESPPMEMASTAVETATSWVAYSRWLLSRRRPLMSRPTSTAQVAAKTKVANTAART